MAPLVISVWQGKPSSSEGVEVALTALAQAASTAAANGAHMLILPELYLGGYRELRATSETSALRVGASHGLTEVSETARRNKIAIVCGFYEKGERGGVYNSAIAVDADGTIRSVYRKTHLFGEAENAAFTPGDRLDDVFTLCGVRCGLLICYEYLLRLQPPDYHPRLEDPRLADQRLSSSATHAFGPACLCSVEFPEAVRTLAMSGAALVLVPTANFFPYRRDLPELPDLPSLPDL